ncbi:NAD(P)H-dependent oxidoreductase [Cytophaga hutchinsonii]|jgi:glutathione-regulated potassium-efflux system ancillary protein KefG|uniref:Kef-type potassium/proton antiporter accessory protein, CPA2 family n=1 Tax=Cytophaga hutchinsonii (strain ATCC 33406 / DSM 1761 / CIP 103989 / NBRC 15051 / NCIMB 9469 / D465) TaxID=269798 RepID=A0A6N4SV73_CYTH3|nr:NAD(P)H-dependent oxidoreductase [Cytophaga hutchinsonii]ABG60310.1 Kef-type potassium/proton antiporter accessory protein, CPA2 family [Cytophaga hutchinsonii ATCC 33406]SFX99110.1 Kef-type potassium/proton antiporter accessory protein, CPA2 family [Cytophaga hutchinsonii ATCC 33406]
MKKVLILFAHPRMEKSRANTTLLKHIPSAENITFHDLYELYPDFNIDVEAEKQLLLLHDIIIWQHPFYWYSCPPLMKQWIDMVLEFGWAYGPGGTALKDKIIFNAITTGGANATYNAGGHNRFTMQEYLRPFEQTAHLCKMIYFPPFLVQGSHRLTDEELQRFSQQYVILLTKMSQGNFEEAHMKDITFLNEICVKPR